MNAAVVGLAAYREPMYFRGAGLSNWLYVMIELAVTLLLELFVDFLDVIVECYLGDSTVVIRNVHRITRKNPLLLAIIFAAVYMSAITFEHTSFVEEGFRCGRIEYINLNGTSLFECPGAVVRYDQPGRPEFCCKFPEDSDYRHRLIVIDYFYLSLDGGTSGTDKSQG